MKCDKCHKSLNGHPNGHPYLAFFGMGFLLAMVLSIVLFVGILAIERQSGIINGIPDEKAVNNYCKSKGYDWGWLDGSCGHNKVKCSKRFSDEINQYKCVPYNITLRLLN